MKIQFIATSRELLDILDSKPHPANRILPEWVAKMPSYAGGKQGVDDNADPNSTIKKCMPVIDSMTAGYYMPLFCDLWIERKDHISFKWSMDTLPLITAQNPDRYTEYPIPEGYHQMAFKFNNPWIIKTPPGWSCLFTHPLNYDDLPFRCIPAIVSTDKFPAPVHFPFFLKEGFQGLIEKGTPLVQVIPFKRETFKSEFSYDKGEKLSKIWKRAESVFFGRYVKFFRETSKYTEGSLKTESKCPFANMFGGSK